MYLNEDTILSYVPKFFKMLHSANQSRYNPKNQTIEQQESLFESIMFKALVNKNIKPETYAFPLDIPQVHELKERKFYGTIDVFVKWNNELYADKYLFDNEDNKLIININRNTIGISNLDDALKKIKFNQRKEYKNTFIFPIFWSYSIDEDFNEINYIKVN